MFKRAKERTVRGKTYTYWYLVENKRIKGKVVQRIVKNVTKEMKEKEQVEKLKKMMDEEREYIREEMLCLEK